MYIFKEGKTKRKHERACSEYGISRLPTCKSKLEYSGEGYTILTNLVSLWWSGLDVSSQSLHILLDVCPSFVREHGAHRHQTRHTQGNTHKKYGGQELLLQARAWRYVHVLQLHQVYLYKKTIIFIKTFGQTGQSLYIFICDGRDSKYKCDVYTLPGHDCWLDIRNVHFEGTYKPRCHSNQH